MYKPFIAYIENKNILHHSQYGFRKQYSTQYAILDMVNKIQANTDKKEFTCGIFIIDLKKRLIQLIIQYYYINFTTVVSEV